MARWRAPFFVCPCGSGGQAALGGDPAEHAVTAAAAPSVATRRRSWAVVLARASARRRTQVRAGAA
eukprot:CAMPEP_0170416872 /NCGR_PEP_ID=MMETSP0117_2-20130122/33398_1 /TAXON_ID=400756 /ORGANISM="Durinskia baltica, Strain CSIRO CS-38" /LENGTH=65 /DNA_ID=CAMNT_0010674987 /DNA_START=63 /DNA_END=260 /DNA_ORIENTATION=+